MAVNIGDLIAGEEEIVLQNIQIPALKGDKGDTGRGISSVIKTSTVGLVDTWTITYTDGSTSSFDVTNGADGDDYVITSEDYQEIADIVLDNIEIPSKTSDLENDSGFIDNTVNDLQNYYKKSETYTKQEVDRKVSSVYKYKGSVATYQDLPSTSLTIGDVYNVESTGDNYAWTGTTWDKLGGEIDLSEYYTKTQVDSALENKVDKVTGKGLSTNDFTNADKTKLNSLENYDDTEVKSDIETLEESQASQDEIIAKLKADHPDIEEEGTDLTLNGTGDFDLALNPKGNITQDGDPSPSNEIPVKVVNGSYDLNVSNISNVPYEVLPSEYQEVEYITSDGNSYIDTNVTLDDNFEIDLNFSYNQEFTDWQEKPIISNWNSSNNYWNLFINSSRVLDLYVKGHYSLGNGDQVVVGKKYHINIIRNNNDFTATVNGIINTFSNSTLTQNSTTLKIFKRGDGVGTSYASIGNVKVYKNNAIQRNMIPCYRKSDNVIGMYDLVSNTFFTNAGTGTFTKGNNVYKQVVEIDTSPNPLYSEEDLYFKAVNGDKFYDNLTSEQKASLENGNWYVHNKSNKFSLQNLTWVKDGKNRFNTTAFRDIIKKPASSSVSINAKCNFENVVSADATYMQNNGIAVGTNGDLIIYIDDYADKTVQEFQTIVNNLNGYIIAELQTPTNTKITNTDLINSLEALSNMKAYQDQTNISQTHNEAQADMIINAKTIMSMRYLQNEIEELKQAILNS